MEVVEPTEAERELLRQVFSLCHEDRTTTRERLTLIRLHVAAEVARETAALLQQLENQASIIRDSCTPANVREERMLRELAELRERLGREKICADYWGKVWAWMERLRPFFFHRQAGCMKPDGSSDGGEMVVAELKAMAQDVERLEWILEKPSRLPIEKGNGEWLIQEYVGHTSGRGNSKREAIDSARTATAHKSSPPPPAS